MYMYKSFIAATAALLIILHPISSFAGGLDDVFASQNNVRAGIYFRIPFAGGLKASSNTDLSYGFAMGVGRSFSSGNLIGPRRSFRADMVKLSFSSRGFETFNFGGQSVLNRRGIWLGQNEGEVGGLGATGMVLGGLAAIALAVVALGGNNQLNAGLPPCRVGTRNSNGNCPVP
jgi:hypothetical protein